MSATRRGSSPVYQQIADDLRQRITTGDLRPGDQLPTQLDLSEQYGVARMTVRQALAELVNQGLVVSQRPVGFFVRDRTPMIYRPQAEFHTPPSPAMDRFMGQITSEGRKPSQTITVEVTTPPADVANRLHIGEGEPAVVRRRVRSIDGEPFNINDSYYPYSIARETEIMSPADVARGINVVLAELGHEQVRVIDEIHVRMPTRDETTRLSLGPGTPVALHISTGYTEDDRPVRCVLNILPGDRHIIMYERTKPQPVTGDAE